MEMFSVRAAYCCWICGKPVTLENCKVDEHGFPVHGDCYVVRAALNSMRPQPNEVEVPTCVNQLRAWRE
jgi:hypothetical protein